MNVDLQWIFSGLANPMSLVIWSLERYPSWAVVNKIPFKISLEATALDNCIASFEFLHELFAYNVFAVTFGSESKSWMETRALNFPPFSWIFPPLFQNNVFHFFSDSLNNFNVAKTIFNKSIYRQTSLINFDSYFQFKNQTIRIFEDLCWFQSKNFSFHALQKIQCLTQGIFRYEWGKRKIFFSPRSKKTLVSRRVWV